MKAQNAIVVPNRSGEVFDVVGTSVSENYAVATVSGLTSPTTTNWTSYPNSDVPNQNISAGVNIKAITTRYTGIPDSVAKVARNITALTGPSAPNVLPEYGTQWAVIHRDGNTVVRRLSDNVEFNAATLDPPNAAKWNQWSARLKGQFDSAGRIVGAYESALTQITAFKFSLGGSTTFTGFSPVMINSGEFIRNELFAQTNNVVYYTKDTTSATTRTARRGNILYCRIEENNYSVEYGLCASPSPIIAIEHVWAFGYQYYIIALTEAGYITFVSSPYSSPIEESARADVSAQSVLYSQIVTQYNGWTTESARADLSALSVTYTSIVITYSSWTTESARADLSAQSVSYALVVEHYEGWPVESAEVDLEPVYLDYIYSPPTPPTPPDQIIPATTNEEVRSTISAQAISYA